MWPIKEINVANGVNVAGDSERNVANVA